MCENSRRISYKYALGQKIWFKCKKVSKHEQGFKGPYEITAVNDNETIRLQKGKVNGVTNIRRIKPFTE